MLMLTFLFFFLFVICLLFYNHLHYSLMFLFWTWWNLCLFVWKFHNCHMFLLWRSWYFQLGCWCFLICSFFSKFWKKANIFISLFGYGFISTYCTHIIIVKSFSFQRIFPWCNWTSLALIKVYASLLHKLKVYPMRMNFIINLI